MKPISLFKDILQGIRFSRDLKKRYERGHKEALDYIARNNPPELSKEEIEEVDRYWERYGVKWDKYIWFQMYYNITGIHDPRFIPHNFADCSIVPYYNNRELVRFWTDKNYFSRLIPCLQFPEVYGQRIGGKYYDSGHKCLANDFNAFVDSVKFSLSNEDTFIVKRTVNTLQGKGVKKYTITTKGELAKVLEQYKNCNDYAIQKVIHQNAFFEQFNKSSVNIIRLTTWRDEKDIVVLAPAVRFGIEGSATDVSYIDGIEIINAVGIQQEGQIKDYYVTLAGDKLPLQIREKTVPKWKEIVAAVKMGHQYLERFDIVAWDVTVDSDEKVVCIEYNLYSPGTIVYQMAHGPMAGERTEAFLAFLTDSTNQKRFIPRMIRKKH